MSQSRVKFRERNQQKIYSDYMTTDRDPLLAGTDGLTSAFHRGFMDPTHIVHDRKSLAYAAWSAGRDRRRKCEIIAKRAGIYVFDVPEDDRYYWKTPGVNLGDAGYRESKIFRTAAEAWQDAALTAQATMNNPEAMPHDIQKAIDQLRSLVPPGTIVYTVRRHMSRTGGKQELSLLIASLDNCKGCGASPGMSHIQGCSEMLRTLPACGHNISAASAMAHNRIIVDLTRLVALALECKIGDYKGVILYNVGADLGAQIVNQLGQVLYPNEPDKGCRSIVQAWL